MDLSKGKIKRMVRKRYAKVAQSADCGCSGDCCGDLSNRTDILDLGKKLDYTNDQLAMGLAEANLGLGCGNPVSMADLKPGETVLDLGSGAGFDAFLAARGVGPEGKVIGVDMTPEMISRAKRNAEKLHANNVEFRLGEIEKLPIPNSSVDVVLSNCVINLSPDKRSVFGEIFRALKPGGRINISDVLCSGEIPREIKENPLAYTGCISGAISPDEVRQILNGLGFESISITRKYNSEQIIKTWNTGEGTEHMVFSAYIEARKPTTRGAIDDRRKDYVQG